MGFTNVSETLLNNVERYAIVVASMGNASDSEQQNRLRKSRENVGKTIQSYRQFIIHDTSHLYTYIIICAVVSTEQYQDPPLFDLQFPDKKDLINYTKSGDISKITIPPSLVQERLGERTSAGISL